MLPNRARLQGWDPGGLAVESGPITSGGAAVESAAATIATNCRTLPELHGWSGESHDAATAAVRWSRPRLRSSRQVVSNGRIETCRALYAGVAGTIGGTVGGTLGGGIGAAGGPLALLGAAGGGSLGTWVFGKLGDEIGQLACAR